MEILVALAGIAGTALFLQSKPLPSAEDYRKAKDKLSTEPGDPDANTTAGKYLAFALGDYESAMPFLLRSGNQTLRILAEHETAPLYADTAVQKVGMGDEWVAAARSFKPLFRIFYDRAAHFYSAAYQDLKTQPVWGDKVRERLQNIYLTNPAAGAPKNLSCPSGWKCPIQETKAGRFQGAFRGGNSSFAVVGWKSPLPAYEAIGQVIDIKPGTFKVSAWVVTDGTNADDQLLVAVQNANGNNVILKPVGIPMDQPWWKKVSFEVEAPAGAVRMALALNISSKQGLVILDDVSIKGSDGRELLKNGGFEDR